MLNLLAASAAESHAELDKGLPWWIWLPVLVGSLIGLWWMWGNRDD